VPGTLIPALDELAMAWDQVRGDVQFRQELEDLLRTYAGRPTPLTLAERFAPGKRLYLKREDLLHTGAHKLNNALGQALLADARQAADRRRDRRGPTRRRRCDRLRALRPRVRSHGLRGHAQTRPNVERMRLLGAEVRPVELRDEDLA
jgi:tryptophan synthase beta chain